MTERVLPPVAVGTRRAQVAEAAVGGDARPIHGTPARPAAQRVARPVARRNEAVLSTPARAGILLGASAAVYAVTLAGVAALQSEADAGLAAARAPRVAEIETLRAANDDLERILLKADAESRALAADYAAVGAAVGDYEARLDSLSALVAEVEGSVAALPSRIKLPSVTMRGAIAGSSRSSGGRSAPSTSATSGASGG